MIKLILLLFLFHADVQETSEIVIFNPVRYNLILELKCNWDGNGFSYHKFYQLNGKKKVIVLVPNNSKCQIWSRLR